MSRGRCFRRNSILYSFKYILPTKLFGVATVFARFAIIAVGVQNSKNYANSQHFCWCVRFFITIADRRKSVSFRKPKNSTFMLTQVQNEKNPIFRLGRTINNECRKKKTVHQLTHTIIKKISEIRGSQFFYISKRSIFKIIHPICSRSDPQAM